MRSLFGPVPVVRNDAPVNISPPSYGLGMFGIPLSRDTTAQLAATANVGVLWQIIDRIATSVAAPEWRLYRRARSGREEDRTPVDAHAVLDLLNKPNPDMLRSELMETVQQPQDLIGESIMLVTRIGGPTSLPMELWPVLPTRIEPVPNTRGRIVAWKYTEPDGTKVELNPADVLRMKRPNPLDPSPAGRGLGPVQSSMSQIDSARYGAEWQRNFFINGAEPGGIIEVPEGLTDEQFNTITRRWREQHQGVANAHRVALIEYGKWVDRKASMRDLQIAELQAIPDEQIRKAFGFPKPLLGSVDDVNRANADAAEVSFSRWLVNPRLERWKQLLNHRLLPMYPGGAGLELDFDNPVPPDAEAIDRERDSKVAAAVALIGAGFSPSSVLPALGLPDMDFTAGGEGEGAMSPEAIGNLAQSLYLGTVEKAVMTWDEARAVLRSAGVPLAEGVPAPVAAPPAVQARATRLPFAMLGLPVEIRAQASEDLERVQQQWEAALERLLDRWGSVTEAQRDALLDQIQALVEDGQLADLGVLSPAEDDGMELLLAAMLGIGIAAAKQQSDEASKQGVSVEPARLVEEDFEQPAAATARLLAAGLAAAAGREALRLATPGVSGGEVAEQVRSFIDDLSDRQLRDQLGGALTAAQNQARFATLEAAPDADYFATEELDSNTCSACRDVDGRRFETLAEARALYANGGYTRCQGRERCRGTVVAVWEET